MFFNFLLSKQKQLIKAIDRGDTLAVKKLISHPKVDINAKGDDKLIRMPNGRSCISAACIDGDTPLHRVAEYGLLEICELLIKHDVNVDVKNNYEQTPLYKAAYNGHLEICELLIQHDADVNTKDNNENPPLYFAVMEGHLKICECLIEHGADVNAKCDGASTMLHFAADGDGYLGATGNGNLSIYCLFINYNICCLYEWYI